MVSAAALLPAGAVAACLAGAGGGEMVEAARVTEQGEVVLADGRTLRLVGVAPLDEAGMAAAIRRHVAGGARLVAIVDKPDRWGRYGAQLAVRGGQGDVSLVEPLVAQGLAALRADGLLGDRAAGRAPASGLTPQCAARLAALEVQARRAGRGGWGGTAPMPLAAHDVHLLKQYEGRFVIVVGRVASVGERRAMTFVNFGRDWDRDFSVRIARADWDRMVAQGVTATALEGQRVMVRGELLTTEREGGQRRRNTGSAPLIRLSEAQGLSILDSD